MITRRFRKQFIYKQVCRVYHNLQVKFHNKQYYDIINFIRSITVV